MQKNGTDKIHFPGSEINFRFGPLNAGKIYRNENNKIILHR